MIDTNSSEFGTFSLVEDIRCLNCCFFAARVIEEGMFGINNLCWISAKATLEASRLAEFLILQTGMTAFGKAYYRNQSDLVPNVC